MRIMSPRVDFGLACSPHRQLAGVAHVRNIGRCTQRLGVHLLTPSTRQPAGAPHCSSSSSSTSTAAAAIEELENFSRRAREDLDAAQSRQHPRQQAAAVVSATKPPSTSAPADAASATDATAPAGLLELNQTTFWPFLAAAGNDLVIVDFYTDWCGPCKLIMPDLMAMAAELKSQKVSIVKFNCKKENKELGSQLQIKVAPTFHLYRNKARVAEMTGAEIKKLRGLISEQQAVWSRWPSSVDIKV